MTQLLAAAARGDDSAFEHLWTLIYDELHAIAQRQMADEAPGRTLQPTALVHEAYMRLVGGDGQVQWANRRHFFTAAARAMRHVRIDDARKRKRQKRGGGEPAGPLPDSPAVFDQDPGEMLAIHDALDQLEIQDSRKAEVVMLRYFVGMTVDETAEALGISPRTVDSDWRFARLWLSRELSAEDPADAGGQDGRGD